MYFCTVLLMYPFFNWLNVNVLILLRINCRVTGRKPANNCCADNRNNMLIKKQSISLFLIDQLGECDEKVHNLT